jgi:hypothetical protein
MGKEVVAVNIGPTSADEARCNLGDIKPPESLVSSDTIGAQLEWCRGPGIDGFYHCGEGDHEADDMLRLLLNSGLLQVYGVEVLEETR